MTYTEKLAFEQAAAADELLAMGVYLGNSSLPHKNAAAHLIVLSSIPGVTVSLGGL